MKNELTLKKVQDFFWRNMRYISIVILLVVTFFYQGIVLIKEEKTDKEDKKSVVSEVPSDLNAKNVEKVYSNVLQSKAGDSFRVGFLAKVDYSQSVEIWLKGALHEPLRIAEITLDPSSEGEYKEVVFFTPGRYDSLVFRLNEIESDPKKWDNHNVFLESLFISRLDTEERSIKNIQPTLFGVNGVQHARLEDMGEVMLYTFSLQGKASDYKSLYDWTPGVHFDSKEDILLGNKRNGEYFTFRFDMQYPYQKFVLEGLRKGVSPDEIRMDYSLDNVFWRDIPKDISVTGQDHFSLSLSGDGETSEIYVRAIYSGEEKKFGTFGLEKLSVIAEVERGINK